jgi:hypothetical protein
MEPITVGELVKVATGGRDVNGIVFDIPSATKVVVAVVEPGRGPTFRTVNPVALSDRSAEGPDDKPLRLLIRRTPSPIHGAARGAPGSGRASAGHTRAATHRTADR